MQIPISVNRSKAAGPVAGSCWAGPAARVCRERQWEPLPCKVQPPAGAPAPPARLPRPPRDSLARLLGQISLLSPLPAAAQHRVRDALLLRRALPRPHLSCISPAWKKEASFSWEPGVSGWNPLAGRVAAEAAVEGAARLGWVARGEECCSATVGQGWNPSFPSSSTGFSHRRAEAQTQRRWHGRGGQAALLVPC